MSGTIQEIDFRGACERVQSLQQLEAPTAEARPRADVPPLIFYAEKEDAVLAECSPTRAVLEATPWTWVPRGECRLVTGRPGRPVQHASFIFHCSAFQPFIAGFYRRLKSGKARQAA